MTDLFPELVEEVGGEKFWKAKFYLEEDGSLTIQPYANKPIGKDKLRQLEKKMGDHVQQSRSKNAKSISI